MEFKKVHSDSRRTIYANDKLLDGKEYTFIKINKGKAIGGCRHSVKENWSIISGRVIVYIGDYSFMTHAPNCGTFEPGEPHAFEALEDSIICEWGVSAEEKQKDIKDKKLLEIVNKINEN